MLTGRGKLAIAELVFYTPALFLAIIVTNRHGFSKHAGWVYLVLLALIRVVGSILELVVMNNASVGLIVAATILSGNWTCSSAFGNAWAVTEGVRNDGTSANRTLPARVFQLLHLPILAASVLIIVGGLRSRNQSSSQQSQGHTLTHAAIILLLVDFAAMSCLTLLYYLPQLRTILQGDKPIIIAVAASTPFLLVRLVYSALAYFETNSTAFNLVTGNVIIRSFMASLEEFITVGLYIAAGLLASTIPEGSLSGHKPLTNVHYELDNRSTGRSNHV